MSGLRGLLRAFLQTVRPVPHRGLSQDRVAALVAELIETRVNGSRLIIRAPGDDRVVEFRLEGEPEQGSLVLWFPYARWKGDSLASLRRILEQRNLVSADVQNLGRPFIRVEMGLDPTLAAEFAATVLVEAMKCDLRTEAVATVHDFGSFSNLE
jgi:hypothetical protein